MFKKNSFEGFSEKVNTIIGKELKIKGEITGKGLIRIDGEAEGIIDNQGDVVIGEGGSVKAKLKARNITIAGNYEGELEAEGRLELKKTANISGSYRVNGLLVEEGAVVNGSIDMKNNEGAAKKSSPLAVGPKD